MKKLLLLLLFVSFAAQAQIQVTDSVYVENGINKARFTGTVYQIVDEPLYNSYDDYFWIDAGTVYQIKNRYNPNTIRISHFPISGNTPDGRSWALWWDTTAIQEDQQLRIDGDHCRISEFAYDGSGDFIIGSTPEILDALETDDIIEFWRLGTLRYEHTHTGRHLVGSRLFN